MGWLDGKTFDANSLEDINTVIANCGVDIGYMTSNLIEVFKEWFPDAEINWSIGCREFIINGVEYGMHLNYYWSNKGPRFYKK